MEVWYQAHQENSGKFLDDGLRSTESDRIEVELESPEWFLRSQKPLTFSMTGTRPRRFT